MNDVFYNWNRALLFESSVDTDIVQPLLREYPGLKLEVYDQHRGDTIELGMIVVPKELQRSGIGSKVMNRLIEWADKNQKTITLTPDGGFGATSVNRLKKFYKEFGFVLNKGRKKDYTIGNAMYRRPESLNENKKSTGIRRWINENLVCNKKHSTNY